MQARFGMKQAGQSGPHGHHHEAEAEGDAQHLRYCATEAEIGGVCLGRHDSSGISLPAHRSGKQRGEAVLRNVERRIPVEKAVGAQREAHALGRHHRVLLRIRDVREARRQPDDEILAGDLAAGFAYLTPAKGIDALNRGFAVSHQYTLLDNPTKPIATAKLGDTVRVTVTVMVQSDHPYVVVEDPLPAGLEPVDARLKNVDPALKAQLDNELAQAAQKQFGGQSYFAPWYRWYYSPWHQVDLRDDRAVLSATRLSKGIYEYVYYARATAPGDFFVAPAHAAETYFPEVFGRSDSSRFVVTP